MAFRPLRRGVFLFSQNIRMYKFHSVHRSYFLRETVVMGKERDNVVSY